MTVKDKSANTEIQHSISTEELFKQYDWFQSTFSSILQNASDNFFTSIFKIDFIGLSKNINCLLDNEPCFVTKIKINQEYDMFFRLTEKTIDIILDKVLGKAKNRFNINKISELEAKIITAFNSFMYDELKPKLSKPDPKELRRTDFNMINLTFILKSRDEGAKDAGKIIVTLPAGLLHPEQIVSNEEKFQNTDFPNCEILAKVIVAKMRFPLFEIQNLELDDVVVFENSNIEQMILSIQDELLDINLNPNMNLLLPSENNAEGEDKMASSNIWDNIEVEMNAEFDAVKISLGELKNIEDGLVVDLTSLYDNNVVLKVEGNPIASGTLVIVNDRYGVKINKILAPPAPKFTSNVEDLDEDFSQSSNHSDYSENEDQDTNYEDAGVQENNENEEEDFDYSDFDLEDEGI